MVTKLMEQFIHVTAHNSLIVLEVFPLSHYMLCKEINFAFNLQIRSFFSVFITRKTTPHHHIWFLLKRLIAVVDKYVEFYHLDLNLKIKKQCCNVMFACEISSAEHLKSKEMVG